MPKGRREINGNGAVRVAEAPDRYTAAAAAELSRGGYPAGSDALAVTLRSDAVALPEAVAEAARAVSASSPVEPASADDLHLKFVECVPPELRAVTATRRNAPAEGARRVGEGLLVARVVR